MNSDDSVYSLITKLCEKYTNNTTDSTVKKLRSKCYELLLGKRVFSIPENYPTIESSNPFHKLLAWQYILARQFDLTEHGQKLVESVERSKTAYGEDTESFNRILQFLLCLKNVPNEDEMSDIEDATYFDIPKRFQKLFANTSERVVVNPAIKDRNDNDRNIWEIAGKSKYSNRRNWESFGYSEPDKELLFLTELAELSHLWVDNLPSVYAMKKCRNNEIIEQSEIKQLPEFINDLKFLLVGMASDSFIYDENNKLILKPNITLNGISDITLERFSKDFINSGLCYKALNQICTKNPSTGHYKFEGFIFTEFCESIQRYLEFHRAAIFNLSNSIGLIHFDYLTKQLREQLTILTSICKLKRPYNGIRDEDIPHGVTLINYLYLTMLNYQIDRNIILVLYSIFFSCCQVYYYRFLHKWILEGTLHDPHNEFFIKCNLKFITTRGRTYWTRGFSLRHDIVPDFLNELKFDILNCGKMMNLVKSCNTNSQLCSYLMGKMPPILSCCVNNEQLKLLKRNTEIYYVEVSLKLDTRISFKELFRKSIEDSSCLIDLISKKRAITLKRIELERKEGVQLAKEKKLDEIAMLKEQYDCVYNQKQLEIAGKILKEIEEIKANLTLEALKEQLIEKEANEMIDYYSNLCEKSERKKKEIERHCEIIKNINLEQAINFDLNQQEVVQTIELNNKLIPTTTTIHSSKSLDILNANNTKNDNEINKIVDNEMNNNYNNEIVRNALENFEIAKENKRKIMSHELFTTTINQQSVTVNETRKQLTEAQKNKLKVLTSEFGISLKENLLINETINKFEQVKQEIRNVDLIKKDLLLLDLNKLKPLNDLNNKPLPMSIDSTPISDLTTPSTSKLGLMSDEITPTITTCTQTDYNENGFNFIEHFNDLNYTNHTLNEIDKLIFSKRVNENLVTDINVNCLHLFLFNSISIPLTIQMKLVNNELLNYLINDLNYLKHLRNLRNYFFLLNGEFCRNLTNNLFEHLYNNNNVNSLIENELINYRLLQRLLYDALDNNNNSCLSFKIINNNLTSSKCFDLGNPNVLDCLSLTYKVQWPLNILLPTDVINKYNEVFKFLLKVNRVSWVMKRIFLEMKMFAKETGKNEVYLMMSPHYRRLHQCRHVMLHFIQTLQNYIIGNVLQTNWVNFKRNLINQNVTNFDELYTVHTAYIKNILFLCFLNQKSTPLRKVLEKIFTVILKFYDYLRSRQWLCENGNYIHPNFTKLESIYKNFVEFILFLIKVIRKVSKSGYQPHLIELLDMLDINDYFSNKNLTV